jgi:hypothetical protein
MTAKRNRRTKDEPTDVPEGDPIQTPRYPREVTLEDYGTLEDITGLENEQADEANVEEIDRTSKDYWGRTSQDTDGAVPVEPPDTDPLAKQFPRKPKGPPKHNM